MIEVSVADETVRLNVAPNPEPEPMGMWGEKLKYEVVKDKDGKERPYIWSERIVDGKKVIVGDAPPKKP